MAEERVELQCSGCGKKFRLRRPPEEIPEELLLCPDCGGRLIFPGKGGGGQEESRIPLEDYLLTGPVALLYWDLPVPEEVLEEFLGREGFAVRRFASREELRHWLRIFMPQVLVYGTEKPELVAECEDFLQNDLPPDEYRRIFRIWVTSRYRTLEPREVFFSGMHLVCHPGDLERFEKVYEKARTYWDNLYGPYYRVLEEVNP
ncbi:hypothetical protein FVE67_00350 [Thermosulfurimonas marina]|uniref:Zinc finger/thioredoxin putative domain-containing protein n=1 Tax=Thermosulfurimonas marina TaxID=2047767 RepID=A0A6H1WQ94_9BACT|nr:hypothetical protein [Thermosulfurimonas marina]QJA05329.1 hypothetical protein FVE67_00350 [Thermosulfurimonas marina]